ncbi:MAG: hypothetical protein NVS9B8_05510 [Candidatus Limnocylindrales bacterium]
MANRVHTVPPFRLALIAISCAGLVAAVISPVLASSRGVASTANGGWTGLTRLHHLQAEMAGAAASELLELNTMIASEQANEDGAPAAPDASETPEPSETPDASESPHASESPEPSETPDASEAPHATEAPHAIGTASDHEGDRGSGDKKSSDSGSQHDNGGNDGGGSGGD